MDVRYSFNPMDFLDYALKVNECVRENMNNCTIKNDQALLRTAVSRAYYAIFLEARERLNITVQDHTVHRRVIERLREEGHPDLSSKLNSLRRQRLLADYNLNYYINERTFKWILDTACSIRQEFDKRGI